MSPAVNKGDLRRLKYNKTVFGRDLSRTLLGDFTTLSQTPESDEEGILPPNSPPLSCWDPKAPCELLARTFRPKLHSRAVVKR